MKKILIEALICVAAVCCIFGAQVFIPSVGDGITKLELGENKNIGAQDVKKANGDLNGFIPYRVKKGDTVYGICRENVIALSLNRAAAMIIEKNSLKGNDDIREGQIIYIPYKDPGNDIEYIVKNGDTIYTIASKLMPGQDTDASVYDIMEENDLTSVNDIEEGQILLIPYDK